MSATLFRQLNLSLIPNSSILVHQVEDSSRTLGRVNTYLTIQNVTHLVTIHVLARFRYPLLIGLDIGRLYGIHVNLRNFTVTLPYNQPPMTPGILALDTIENTALQRLLVQYTRVFSRQPSDIGRIKVTRHEIHTVPHPPIQRRPYRRPSCEYEEIKRQVSDLLQKGLIRESMSPWAFPVTLAPKKDGGKRLCIDFRPLNAITIDDKMPMPRIQDVLDRLQGARYFTTLDVAWGFWHIEMHPNSVEKTAFVTNEGHYEWLVLPFGLKNSPSTFQRTLQHILGPLLYSGAINYMDDIIIYSDTFESHLRLLADVLHRLQEHNVKLKLSKCSFARTSVAYLGHIIEHNSVKPSTDKVQAIRDFPVPGTLRQCRQFVGLTQWFRRFIPHYTRIAKPLTDLTKKENPFRWDTAQQNAFTQLKDSLCSPPVIALYDPSKPCTIFCDGSQDGIGATLTQNASDGIPRVIEYFSRRVTPKNLTASELECLAVIESVEHFEAYLSLPFTVITDHSALQWLLSLKKPKGRLYRWSVRLSTYTFNILHRSGKSQAHVDALSRSPIDTTTGTRINNLEIITHYALSRAPVSLHLSAAEIATAQQNSDLSYVKKPILRQNLTYIKQGPHTKAVIPESLRIPLLKQLHDESGHPGKNKLMTMLAPFYWWPNIANDVRQYVSSCQSCQKAQYSHQPTPGKYVAPESDLNPLDLISIDTIEMGSAAKKTKHQYIQVFIDHHSRYIWAYPVVHQNAETLESLIRNLFKSGIHPKRILTDNFKSFISAKFRKLLKNNGIKHSFSTLVISAIQWNC